MMPSGKVVLPPKNLGGGETTLLILLIRTLTLIRILIEGGERGGTHEKRLNDVMTPPLLIPPLLILKTTGARRKRGRTEMTNPHPLQRKLASLLLLEKHLQPHKRTEDPLLDPPAPNECVEELTDPLPLIEGAQVPRGGEGDLPVLLPAPRGIGAQALGEEGVPALDGKEEGEAPALRGEGAPVLREEGGAPLLALRKKEAQAPKEGGVLLQETPCPHPRKRGILSAVEAGAEAKEGIEEGEGVQAEGVQAEGVQAEGVEAEALIGDDPTPLIGEEGVILVGGVIGEGEGEANGGEAEEGATGEGEGVADGADLPLDSEGGATKVMIEDVPTEGAMTARIATNVAALEAEAQAQGEGRGILIDLPTVQGLKREAGVQGRAQGGTKAGVLARVQLGGVQVLSGFVCLFG